MKIVLCGYMGSGKSNVGELLANKLRYDFIDLDKKIEAVEGKSIPKIFSEKSEIYFRKKENEVLKSVLESKNKVVISLGGGTPCYADNLEQLKNDEEVYLIYLKVDLHTLTNRLSKEQENRPLLKNINSIDDLEDYIRKHLFERQFYYMQSDLIVDSSLLSVEEIAQQIEKKLL
ncbi:shikimate kinase [Mesonia aquimarina]|uniref:shikimate kinase n=1 Tax=Mesonia aquimarina TaxID=1504967 RepID=UPI000EF62875|nr:shikimate kinase [Mesonia aquimarina]